MKNKMFLIAGVITTIVSVVMLIDLIKNFIDSSNINTKDVFKFVGMSISSAVLLFRYFNK